MISVENKIVLITGASSGIGESCAQIFAQSGAQLILLARRQEKLEKLRQKLQNSVKKLQKPEKTRKLV